MNLSQIHITTPEHISVRYKLAGLGSRAAAQLIDWIILLVVQILFVISFIQSTEKFSVKANGLMPAILILVLFIINWGYFMLFEFFTAGRTPGKMLMGLRVVQDNGQPLTFLSSFLRNILRLIDFLPILYVIGILMIFLHSRHKRIGDLAAGTIVVFENKRKRRNKDPLLAEIEQKGIDINSLPLDERSLKKIGSQEWKILKTYMERRTSMSDEDRKKLTVDVARIIFPILGMAPPNEWMSVYQVEEALLIIFVQLRDDWAF